MGDAREKADLAGLTRRRWEANADYWIKIIRERRDRYRTDLTDAAVLDAIGPAAGRRILDAGCGEGYLARELAARGGRVAGVDACGGLIRAAAGAAPAGARTAGGATGAGAPDDPGDPAGAAFAQASVAALPFGDEVFDVVACNHLFSHLPDPAPAVREFGRVLRGGGRLVILTLHPCFYTGNSERGATDSVPASRYFAARGVDQRFVVDGLESPAMITSWLRPLEYYAAVLREAGFVIADLREPHPAGNRIEDDPFWRAGFPAALFILFVAERR